MLSPEPDSDYEVGGDRSDGSSSTLSLVKISVLSALPEGEPQGTFVIRAPPTASGRDLLRLVCRQAKVPLHPSYVLLTSDGVQIPTDGQLMSITCIQEGKTLLWNISDKTDFAGSKCWNAYWFMALLSFIIGSVGYVAIIFFYTRVPSNTQYGIVFDAGSSHSAMYVYKWEGDKINLTAVAVQDGKKCTAEGGGISSYSNNTATAGKSLQQCLDSAKQQIPGEKHADTPVYLGATAGMRLLEKENPKVSEEILESIRTTFKTYPFQFANASSQARILSGAEEGAFGWITSNFITGSFRVHPTSDVVKPDLIVDSVGALDLGGASTQITFVPNDSAIVPRGFHFDSNLYGRPYSLYTYSFLCYGVNEAASRLMAVLVEKFGAKTTDIVNPCAPNGSIINVSHSELFSSACVNSSQAFQAFGRYIIMPRGTEQQDALYIFHGGSNQTACQELVKEHLFNLTAPCSYENCSFNGVFQPPVFGDFYAFSSYYYVMEFLNLSTPQIDHVEYENFSQATQTLCGKDWNEVKTMKTDATQNLPWYCFQSVYIDTLLVHGYHFHANSSWASIHFVGSIGGEDAGWTLGFIINESNKLSSKTPARDLTTVTFALLALLFSAFLITSFLFMRWAVRRKKASKRSLSFRGNTYGAI